VLHIRRKRKTAAATEYIKAGAREQIRLLFPETDYEVSSHLLCCELDAMAVSRGTLRAHVERVLLPTRKGGDLGRPPVVLRFGSW
jgi:hypothetical protein